MPRARSNKSLCIVDTCALVDLSEIELARRPLQKWLWQEFEIKYSQAVLDEFRSFQSVVSFREHWEDYVWRFPNTSTYERAIFSSHRRRLENVHCKRCGQITWKNDTFKPDLEGTKDRGERHNCCIALDAVSGGQHAQIIFLTDDLRAMRDYVAYFFDTFPLGLVWSLLDFITYLFMRYHKNISLEDAKSALRDVNTGSTKMMKREDEQLISQDIQYRDSEKKQLRLMTYYRKVEQVADIFSRLPGGR